MIKKLYLAHPLEMREEIRKIELKIEKCIDIELVNPFFDLIKRDLSGVNKDLNKYWQNLDYNNIVENDLRAIEYCDGIVAYIERKQPTIGTLFEIWHCYKVLQKPVFIVSPDSNSHPWIRHIVEKSAGKSFDNWIQFANYMTAEDNVKKYLI